MCSSGEPDVPIKMNQSSDLKENIGKSLIHNGDTDSSDDEDNRYSMEAKYNEYGRSIKRMLAEKAVLKESCNFRTDIGLPKKSNSLWKTNGTLPASRSLKSETSDVYTDPVFGIRIKNPLITSAQLQGRMVGRKAIPMARVKYHVTSGDVTSDWVIGGVIVQKSPIKTSQKGSQYCIWKLSDLKDGLKTVSLFLFRNSHKNLWKTPIGTVVGILNPSLMESRDDGGDEATLSVDNSQKVMILGVSKDYGTCKSKKKNGDNCTAFVNTNKCEYCIYHVQKEYKKCSRRSELQSPNIGNGLNALRNKILGKNEVFYGGKSFMAVPAKVDKKLSAKDNQRLMCLSDAFSSSPNMVQTTLVAKPVPPAVEQKVQKKGSANRVELSKKQVQKDRQRLQLLRSEMSSSKSQTYDQVSLKEEMNLKNTSNKAAIVEANMRIKSPVSVVSPKLQLGLNTQPHLEKSAVVDLSTPIKKSHVDRAKMNALRWVQKNGPINRKNPNEVKKSPSEVTKRCPESIAQDEESSKKKKIKPDSDTPPLTPSTVLSSRFQELLQVKSRHTALIEASDDQAQEQYFNTLEKREKMEEKMLTTFKVDCKAVRCLKCKYTSFSASDMCKTLGHPIKVIDAVKRFFRCHDCGNRTVSLELIPLMSCKQCGGSQWQRAPMMKERKDIAVVPLSIRGGEEKFLGCLQTEGNMSLLVPID
ncbi:protein MCM10 homolog isoform X2 [Anabrus simplex]